jgi:hypothetical protein
LGDLAGGLELLVASLVSKTLPNGAKGIDFRAFSLIGCLIFGKTAVRLKYLAQSPINNASFRWDR